MQERAGREGPRSSELVRGAQEGDEAALNELIRRYQDRVLTIIRARMGAQLRTHTESADMLQETFIQVVKSIDQYEQRDDAAFLNWVAKLAERRIKAQVGHQQAQKRDIRRNVGMDAPRADSQSGSFQISADVPIPAALAADREELLVVVDTLAELSDEHREVIVLRHFVYDEERSWKRIADELDKSTEAARMLYSRAVMSLHKALRRRGQEPPDAAVGGRAP